MSIEYDIRRSIRIEGSIKGSRMANALQKLAEEQGNKYLEKLLYDIDGKRTLIIGIQNEFSFNCLMIRTGKNLINKGIILEDSYDIIGVGSSDELQPYMVLSLGYDDRAVISSIESARDRLEELLNQ